MKKIILSILITLGMITSVFAQSSDLQVLSIVKYNGSESITVKQLKNRCKISSKMVNGRALTLDEKKQVLQTLIEEKLILQAAAKAGIAISNSQIDEYFLQTVSAQVGANLTEKQLNDMILQSQGITLDQLLINQTGMNTADYKAYLKNQLIMQQYIVMQKKDDINKQEATDSEIKSYYEANKTKIVQEDMLKLFIVIVPKGSNADGAKITCNDLRNKFLNKKLTKDQIIGQSKTSDSTFQAGEMLVPKKEESAYGLGMSWENLCWLFDQKTGFLSDMNETKEDFRFVSISNKYSAKMLGLNDLVQPDSNVTVYNYIKEVLSQQKKMQYVQYAAQEVVNSLNKPEYVDNKKTGADLDKLLNWSN